MSKIRLFGTSSGYVEIAPAAAASNNTLTAPSTVGEIIAKDAAGAIGITSMKASNVNVGAAVTITESGIEASGIGITCANINGAQIGGRRNIIMNGDMRVAQRGTSFASPGNDTYTVDRWRYIKSLATGDVTITQSSTSPPGHTYSLKVDITTADTDIAASELSRILFSVEGSTIQGPAKGTSAAKEMRLSFWVRSNKTGTYNCLFYDKDNSRNAGNTYTINAADTWEHKVLKIPADTTGAFGNDNGDSLEVYWHLAAGSDRKSGTLRNTAWATYAAADEAVGHNVNLFDSTSNEWYITGVQLEVGEEATDFEYCSYAEELQLCKRYYNKKNPSYGRIGHYITAGLIGFTIDLPCEMRASPTITNEGGYYFANYNGSAAAPSSIQHGSTVDSTVRLALNNDSGGSQGGNCFIWSGSTYYILDADF